MKIRPQQDNPHTEFNVVCTKNIFLELDLSRQELARNKFFYIPATIARTYQMSVRVYQETTAKTASTNATTRSTICRVGGRCCAADNPHPPFPTSTLANNPSRSATTACKLACNSSTFFNRCLSQRALFALAACSERVYTLRWVQVCDVLL